jgi:transketolase
MKSKNNSKAQSYDSTRDGFGIGLKEVGELNEQVITLCADLSESTRTHWFQELFPERFIEVGVAEENMIGVAAGLALTGKIPFASSYATFVVNNALGPIRSSVCYTNSNVKIIGGHAGFCAHADGATHQALEDIATMRVLPNMTVVVPCDKEEARKTTHAISKHIGPCYLRVGKHKSLNITNAKTPFKIGKANILKKGRDLTIITCGSMVAESLKAAAQLEKKHSIEVINMHTIKPLDHETILKSVKKTGAILTVEEHQKIGGLGSAVAEFLSQSELNQSNKTIPFKILGVDDSFGESGTTQELFKKHKLTSNDIAKEIKLLIKKVGSKGKYENM